MSSLQEHETSQCHAGVQRHSEPEQRHKQGHDRRDLSQSPYCLSLCLHHRPVDVRADAAADGVSRQGWS